MKKIIGVISFILVFSFVFPCFALSLYPETMMVIDFDYEENLVICTTYGGRETFGFKGIEDWEIGDLVSMIMNDNGTEFQYDDMIEDEKWSGYVDPEIWLHPEEAP